MTVLRYLPLLAVALAGARAGADPAAAGDALRGAEVFYSQCAACHLATARDPAPIGPQLYGVIGRRAGSWDSFNYTAAMRAAGFSWDRERLDVYLQNPYALVPGAAMGLLVPVAENRTDVIAFLATLPEVLKQPARKPPAPP